MVRVGRATGTQEEMGVEESVVAPGSIRATGTVSRKTFPLSPGGVRRVERTEGVESEVPLSVREKGPGTLGSVVSTPRNRSTRRCSYILRSEGSSEARIRKW